MVWERLKEVLWQYSGLVTVEMDMGLRRRIQFVQVDECWVGNDDCDCNSIDEVSNNAMTMWQVNHCNKKIKLEKAMRLMTTMTTRTLYTTINNAHGMVGC